LKSENFLSLTNSTASSFFLLVFSIGLMLLITQARLMSQVEDNAVPCKLVDQCQYLPLPDFLSSCRLFAAGLSTFRALASLTQITSQQRQSPVQRCKTSP
jgi:hypothetical protein